MGLIRFLIISIAVLYIIRSIVRAILPMLFQSVVNKAQQPGGNQQQQYRQPERPEGKIKVDYIPENGKRKGTVPDSEGDFIDYEEIK